MHYDLSDYEGAIKPMPKQDTRHSPRGRRILNGIFWVLRSGAPWRALPENYGPSREEWLRVARLLSRLLKKGWLHCRPRSGSAGLIGVAFAKRRALVVHSVSETISPKGEDDAMTTPKQTGVRTFPRFIVDVAEGPPH